MHGDLGFLLDHRDSAVVAVREPVRERGPEDPATDDRDVPGLHGPIPSNRPEFIMAAHGRWNRSPAATRWAVKESQGTSQRSGTPPDSRLALDLRRCNTFEYLP